MNTKIKKQNLLHSAILAIFLAFFVFNPALGATGIIKALGGLNRTANKAFNGIDNNNKTPTGNVMTSVPVMIGKIVGAVLAFLGVIFLLLMIYGGIMWMTARGNDSQVQKAKDIMEAAIIGLVITLSAYAITAFIGGQITNQF